MMDIDALINNKDIKPKEKTESISLMLLNSEIEINELIGFAKSAKDPVKATCIEAIEYSSKNKPSIVTPETFGFVTETLREKAPRVKWESAKVIGNTAHLFQEKLEPAIVNLLVNTEHEGTVVRWSAAFALGEIIKLNTSHNFGLLPAVDAICGREEKNSIRKIYLDALKKLQKANARKS